MAVTSDAELYRKYADELIRFCSALVGPSGAEDLLAAAVVKALAAPRWAGVDNKRAYLYRVVLNEAYRARRDTARRLEREARSAGTEAVHNTAVDRDVVTALLRLSVRQRAVVFLTYWAEWLKAPFHRVRAVERLAVARIVVERERLRHYGFTPIGHDGRRLGYTLWPGKPAACVKALRDFGWEVTAVRVERRVPASVWCLIGVGLAIAGVAWSAATNTGGGLMLVVVSIFMVGTYLRGRAIARLVDSA
jgi:hypothetical protein